MILFLVLFAAVLYAAEKYSLVHAFDEVTVETATDRVLVEPGEEFSWFLTITNGKRTMVPYLGVREAVPEGLYFSETGKPVEKKDVSGLSSVLYVAGKQQVKMERKVALPRRGRYFFRGSSAEAGDFLGFKSIYGYYPELKEMVVKPKALPTASVETVLGGFLGEYSVKKSLFEDPKITIGFREYTGREPFRSISWLQSAKAGRLMVRQYDSTADLSCTVLLNTDCENEERRSEWLELCYSAARNICEELERKKLAYDFKTNGIIAGAMGNWNQVGDGLGAGHLETVLEGLGRMTYGCRESAAEFFSKAARGLPGKRNFIIVTPGRGQSFAAGLSCLEEASGARALVFDAAEMEGEHGRLDS